MFSVLNPVFQMSFNPFRNKKTKCSIHTIVSYTFTQPIVFFENQKDKV